MKVLVAILYVHKQSAEREAALLAKVKYSLACQKIGIALAKKGNSSEQERIELLKKFFTLFSPYLPANLAATRQIFLGDQEFIGEKWFCEIIAKGFSMIMRLRKDDYLSLVALAQNTTMAKLQGKIKRKVRKNGFFFSEILINGKTFYYVVLANSNPRAKKKDKLVRLFRIRFSRCYTY